MRISHPPLTNSRRRIVVLSRLLSLLVILLLLAGWATLSIIIAPTRMAAAPELLVNGSFEAQWRGWAFRPIGTGTGNMHLQAARTGSFGALIRGGGEIRQVLSGLAPATSYTLTGFARTSRAASPTGLQVSDFGGATAAQLTSGINWEALTISFTTGPQATSAIISVIAPLSDDRIHYADDLSLLAAQAPTQTAAPVAPTAAPTLAPTAAAPALDGLVSRVGTQYTPLDMAFQSTLAVANPYRDLRLRASFSGPGGQHVNVDGFWDGGSAWRVRFTPTAPGDWSYQLASEPADPGLAEAGTITVAPASPRQNGFVRVDGATHRSFVYDSGRPYHMLGTTGYTLARTALGGGDWKASLDGSAANGITKVRTLVYPWVGPGVFPDRAPFVANNHDQPDLAYWQALDTVVSEAAARGLVVDLILFTDEPQAFATPEQDQRYVRAILARYAAYPNVIWTLSNEWEYTGKDVAYWNSIGALVAAEDPYATNARGERRPLSIHNKTGGVNGGRFAFAGQAWPSHAVVQYGVRNGTTAFGDVWAQQSILRNAGQGWPVVNDEIGYFGEQAKNPAGTALMDRTTQRQALWAAYVAGGSASVGDTTLVLGAPAWRTGLWNDTGAAHDDILRLSGFFTTRGIPFGAMASRNDLVAAGTRVYALAGDTDIVIYAAVGGKVTITLPPGTWDATRYDPRTGATSALSSASGSASWGFTSLDWVVQLHRR